MEGKTVYHCILVILLLALAQPVAFAQETDVEGSSDHPLLPRMEHFYISGYDQYGYESHEFYDTQDNEYVIEGRKWVIEYTLRTGFEAPGQLKVRRNYIDAIKRIGGTILFDRGLYMKVANGNKATWIEVWVSDHGTDYTLTLVEEATTRQAVGVEAGTLVRETREAAKTAPVDQSSGGKEDKKDANIKRIEQALAATKKNRDEAISNLREVSQKVRSGLAMACPDVAVTPPSPAAVPVPYPNISVASSTAKGSKAVKFAADRAVALKNEAHFKKTEGDELGRKARTLVEVIQSHYEKGTIAEKDTVSWKDQLLSYQDQTATIVQVLEKYVEEIEQLLAESKKQLGIR
jgi:hypothetical protein